MVTQQTDFPNFISPNDWQSVQDLIEEVQREEQCAIFAKTLFQWDLAVKMFRKVEMKRFIIGTPNELDFKFHAICLGALVSLGSALSFSARGFAVEELQKFNVTRDQIEAYVEELKQSFREWHHGFTKPEIKSLKNLIFGEA